MLTEFCVVNMHIRFAVTLHRKPNRRLKILRYDQRAVSVKQIDNRLGQGTLEDRKTTYSRASSDQKTSSIDLFVSHVMGPKTNL